jgi:hypothetical protein
MRRAAGSTPIEAKPIEQLDHDGAHELGVDVWLVISKEERDLDAPIGRRGPQLPAEDRVGLATPRLARRVRRFPLEPIRELIRSVEHQASHVDDVSEVARALLRALGAGLALEGSSRAMRVRPSESRRTSGMVNRAQSSV